MSGPPLLALGSTFVGRFRIVGPKRSGGMGVVYQAHDLASGAELVALKLVAAREPTIRGMFLRECGALGRLSHPGIVRHLDHGFADEDTGWLVLAWVEGPTLATRLAKSRLDAVSTLALGLRLTDALAAVHAHGLVHRDVKPSNIILDGGDPARPVLIDFGTVRGEGFETLTELGSTVGTAGYMAPEQLVATDRIGPATDVWGAGAVLWECLAGERMIEGNTAVARIASTMLGEARSLDDFELWAPIAAAIAAMVRRDPESRPADGAAARDALPRLTDAPRSADRRALLGHAERTLLCVLYVLSDTDLGPGRSGEAETEIAPQEGNADATGIARAHGMLPHVLGPSAYVAWMSVGAGATPSLIAWRAAKCALAIRSATRLRVAVAIGLGTLNGAVPVGEVSDRALALSDHAAAPGGVRIDSFAAGLIEPFARIGHDDISAFVQGALGWGPRATDPMRAPLVGRARELAVVTSLISSSAEDCVARLMLVTGEPGFGKSRLCDEVLRGIPQDTSLLFAECDSSTQHEPLLALRMILRLAVHAPPDCDSATWRRFVETHARALGLAPDRTAFLGEIAGPADPDVAPEVLAARKDPASWIATIAAAFGDWLDTWSLRNTTVIAVDDVQWCDAPSLWVLHVAFARVQERPLAIVAFGRPDTVKSAFFQRADCEHLHLAPLRAHHAVELVKRSTRGAVSEDQARALSSIADGSPLFLLELARAARLARAVPRTLTAVLHGRFQALSATARRLLRAAAIFGVTFPLDGCAAVAGIALAEIESTFAEAVHEELVDRPSEGHGRFRHALVRAAAYEMLEPKDRVLGHHLAAAWIAANHSDDDANLAMHLDESDQPARAAVHWLKAARRARTMNDREGTERLATFGLECTKRAKVSPDVTASLCLLLAESLGLTQKHGTSIELAERAMLVAPMGSSECYEAMAFISKAVEAGTDRARCLPFVDELRMARPDSSTLPAYVRATLQLASSMALSGAPEVEAELMPRVGRLIAESGSETMHADYDGTMLALRVVSLDYGAALRHGESARERWSRLQAPSREASASRVLGMLLGQIGDEERAQVALDRALEIADRLGFGAIRTVALATMGLMHEIGGRYDIAYEFRRRAVEEVAASDDRRARGTIIVGLGRVLAKRGDWTGAKAAAEEGLRLLEGSVRASRAEVLLAELLAREGNVSAALVLAERARESLGRPQDRDHLAHGHLATARVFLGAGMADRALEVASAGSALIRSVAASLGDAAASERMLLLPRYAELVELAASLGTP